MSEEITLSEEKRRRIQRLCVERGVAVVGEFNGWDASTHYLHARGESGVWEGFIPGVGHGDAYQLCVISGDGAHGCLKADPMGTRHAPAPQKTSVVWDTSYEWGDESWMRAQRQGNLALSAPISIYEVHLGSWRRGGGGEFLGYAQLGHELADHLDETGFTHVELLPVTEHPFYGSWGYQSLGFFAPSSRQGEPQDFKAFVDIMHQRGYGVILDWVPSHFPEDEHGLANFDGEPLYEHPDPRRGFHPDWKSCIFDYGSPQVRSFLISSALHWLDCYHIDGLRVDAVASMLYLDYSRGPGEWEPNCHGGSEHLEAIAFLQQLNSAVYERFPHAQTIAEESTAWPGVTRPVEHGGLGFGLKWDMGWMHDTLGYMQREPIHRSHHHDALTFRTMYAFGERYVLALSHDEVVHEKRSLLEKMPGDSWQQLANLRALYGYMWGQPGKKSLFMGAEFAQRVEWNHDAQLSWELLERAPHAGMMEWVGALNRLYCEQAAMHELDCEERGFEWVDGSDAPQSVLTFLRWDRQRQAPVLVVCHFTPVVRQDYRVGVPRAGRWECVLSSDEVRYGGSGAGRAGVLETMEEPHHGFEQALSLTMPPLAVSFFVWRGSGKGSESL